MPAVFIVILNVCELFAAIRAELLFKEKSLLLPDKVTFADSEPTL